MLATFCSSGPTLLSCAPTSRGILYVAVKGLSAAAYTLVLEWRGSMTACGFGALYGLLIDCERYFD